MTSPEAQPDASLRGLLWPAIVVALLAGHVLLVTGALALSWALIPGATVAPAGYGEALAWDEQKAQQLASDQLAWTFEAAIVGEPTVTGARSVRFLIRDDRGEPIDDAALNVRLYHLARPQEAIDAEFATGGPYLATLPIKREGFWKLSAVAQRDADRLLVDQDLWFSPAGGFRR